MLFFLALFSAFAHSSEYHYRIKYECDIPILEERLQTLTPVTIESALTKLREINPEIHSRLVDRLERKRLTISCSGGKTFKADAYAKKPYFAPYSITIQNRHISEGSENEIGYLILHELLHFAKVDNFSTRIHNSIWSRGLQYRDVVYACSFSIFPAKKHTSPDYDQDIAIKYCESFKSEDFKL